MRNRRLIWLSPLCVPFTWGQRAGIGDRLSIIIDGAWKTVKTIFITKSGIWKTVASKKIVSRQAWK